MKSLCSGTDTDASIRSSPPSASLAPSPLLSAMDTLEEDLTCSVCYSLFSDPRVLPCSHTFCKSCLDNLVQASSNYSIWRPLRMPLKCPNCRSVAELPPSGVDALPTNVCLRAIVEKYQRDSEPRPPSCPEHQRQPLNMYCVQDRQLICGLCLTIGGHQGHCIDDLQAAFVREKRTPAQLLARLSERRWAQVCELGEQLEQEKTRCEALVRQDRQEVAQFFQSLEALLAGKRQACLDALDRAGAEVSRAYDPLIHKVKDLQEEQLDLVSLGSSVEDEDSPLVFLEKVHLLRERVEEFISTPMPSVPHVSISPRAAQFLQQRWAAVTLGGLEEAPVPSPSCCTRCGNVEMEAEEARPGWQRGAACELRPLWAAMLLGLLLALAAWVDPGGGAWMGGAWMGVSTASQLSQTLHGLSCRLLTAALDTAACACALAEAAVESWGAQVCSASHTVLQWFTAMLDSLTETKAV